MDPAALGTTIIGLDAIRNDEARSDRPIPHHRSRRRLGTARQLVAAALRRTADAIAPAPAPLTVR